MGNIKNATHLDLSNQNLVVVPEHVFSYRNLRSLNLSGNLLNTIPLELNRLKHLRVLDLSKNRIKQLQAGIFGLTKLQVLNLNDNGIRSLPKQVGQVPSLQKLFMNKNLLNELPAEIASLQQLTHLAFTKNRFTLFPKIVLELRGLTHLWLANNPLAELPGRDLLYHLPNLKALYCFDPQHQLSNMPMAISRTPGNIVSVLKLANGLRKSEESLSLKSKAHSIFISYSHKDVTYKQEVESALKGLKNVIPDLQLEYWSDEQLVSGRPWEQQIEAALQKAGIAILLTSRDFMASNFIMTKEVPIILKRAQASGIRMLVLVVGESLLRRTPLQTFQFVNAPDQPLKSLSEHGRDIIYNKLAEDIIEYLK